VSGDLERALPAVRHALRTLDTSACPFTDALPARLLLEDGGGGPLAPETFEAVRRAALDDGHEEAWLLPFWGTEDRPTAAALLDLRDPRAYLDEGRWPDGAGREHAVVARDAAWAWLTDEEDDALLGGPPHLVAAVRAALPGDEARRARRWLRWRHEPPGPLLDHLGLPAPDWSDALGDTLRDEGRLRLDVRPHHAGVVLALARLGRPDRAFDPPDRDIDPRRLAQEARRAVRGERPWFQVRVLGPDVLVRVGEHLLEVELEDLGAVAALRGAVAPSVLAPSRHYGPQAREAMAVQLASLR
jgi:hypothetical protein